MTLFDQRVNIKMTFSVYSIYVTYLFRSKDLATVWFLVPDIQSYKIQISIMQGLEEGFKGFQNIRVIGGFHNWYQFVWSPQLVPNKQNVPYLRSNSHLQMTVFDQRVNIRIIYFFHGIYVTYSFRSKDLTAV